MNVGCNMVEGMVKSGHLSGCCVTNITPKPIVNFRQSEMQRHTHFLCNVSEYLIFSCCVNLAS
jgi:hypothetical protein